MSNYYKKTLSLAGVDFSGHSINDLRSLVREILEAKIHGICFSPYVEGQGPGTELAEAQIRERLAFVQPYVRCVRTFSCKEGHELIPHIAAENGLKTMVGVWLDSNREENEKELANAIEVARAGHADILAVGNEVLLRGDLSEDELIDYINRARQAVPGVDIGYVEFWEGCPAEHSLLYMKEMYRIAVHAANGKKVIIAETGWPNVGTSEKGAVPSVDNAIKYFINTYQWAEEDGIEIFYFSSFDETWKVDAEGDVGAFWGLWDKDGNLKYV
jgi:exo-beta-1,3-glucanase (GH17 family)